MRILGCDPGLSGALALYDSVTHDAPSLDVVDMPVLALSRNGKAKNAIDYVELARLIDSWSPIDAAYVELVGGIAGQSAAAAFQFGRATGIVLGVIAGSFIPVIEIAPVTWKRAMGIKAGAGKDASLALIKSLYPRMGSFARKKDDGRAEACLIALYGARRGNTP